MIRKVVLLSMLCAQAFAAHKTIPAPRPTTPSVPVKPTSAPRVYTIATFVIRSSI